jgi:hypothetical protein
LGVLEACSQLFWFFFRMRWAGIIVAADAPLLFFSCCCCC